MITFTNSKGKVFNYTETELNNILASLNSGDISYYKVRHDIIFIKINSNLLLIFDYTFNINRIIFNNYDIIYNADNNYNLEFVDKILTLGFDIDSCYTLNGYLDCPINPLTEVFLYQHDTTSAGTYVAGHDLVKSSGIFGGDAAV